MRRDDSERGVTLLEILIVVVLLAILLILGWINWQTQVSKARDAYRKASLDEWKKVLFEYQGDTGCFPDEALMTCGSSSLEPYLDTVPCDPVNNGEYRYLYHKENCGAYYIYAKLENGSDTAISSLGCGSGCGPSGSQSTSFNYYVSSEGVTVNEGAGGFQPTCGSTNKYCFPGICSTCCPGVNTRCNSAGDWCLIDANCSQ